MAKAPAVVGNDRRRGGAIIGDACSTLTLTLGTRVCIYTVWPCLHLLPTETI